MIYPRREHIIRINHQVIKSTKGLFVPPDNLSNPNSLEWVLNTIQYPLSDLYETLESKASLLAWTIIRSHVFNDGNKRTGMVALETFLKINGENIEATDDEIKEIALYVADPEYKKSSKINLISWIYEHKI
ncbi:MAG TPA: hypothetical protein DF984_00405 [Anaerolineaceae bacterium]|nr:hypothetical protein [Anaerolineaceae bacterium]